MVFVILRNLLDGWIMYNIYRLKKKSCNKTYKSVN